MFIHIVLLLSVFLLVLYMNIDSKRMVKEIVFPLYASKALKDRDFEKEKRQAALKPLRLFIEESQKEDRASVGVFGVSSIGIDVRSPYHIDGLRKQNMLEETMDDAKKMGKDGVSFEDLKKKMDVAMRSGSRDMQSTITENQIGALQLMSDGQPIPTVLEGDAIDDMLLSTEEYIKMVPQMRNLQEEPNLFDHTKFSIQTRPGVAERAMEGRVSI